MKSKSCYAVVHQPFVTICMLCPAYAAKGSSDILPRAFTARLRNSLSEMHKPPGHLIRGPALRTWWVGSGSWVGSGRRVTTCKQKCSHGCLL